ncbi:nitroreductase [Fodinicola feengrottensis]|uniref:Nitroreductase family protein n=1 Tax=Fodinicola feengrottensis TaxID=435914 RepID=A0ABN2GUE4_9ACTN|nr:nitroreductase [Fodinicola feengrottensis]
MDQRAFAALEPIIWRAPSAHNTQPWTLNYQDSAIDIGWDRACELPAGDPTGRDLQLSLGAFVETALVVAGSAGLPIDFTPDHGDHRIGRLMDAAGPYASPFTADDVRKRASNRGAYEPGQLDESLLAELNALASTAGGAVRAVGTRDVAALLYEADRHLFSSVPVTKELAEWVRLARTHPSYHRDGLSDRALALSRAEAAGLHAALAVHRPLHRLGLATALAAASKSLLAYDGTAIVLVGPPESDVDTQVTFGRVLMRIWLTLSSHGFANHPLSQIIDAPTTRRRLADRLGFAAPQLLHLARVGRPLTAAPHSPRRVASPWP